METVMSPGCDYNHWLILLEFPKDTAPTREQMIETYLYTLATVLGRFHVSIQLINQSKLEAPNTRAKYMSESDREMAPGPPPDQEEQDKERLLNLPLD